MHINAGFAALTAAIVLAPPLPAHKDSSDFLSAEVLQLVAVIVTSTIGTAVILYFLKRFMEIRPKPEEEQLGMDLIEHAESAY
ncbi:Ammonium Transporter Family protein [Legionella drozanskii LLAP-1]|uniref:Ammonium Transporter Family protein n=1 Tax=Legionella drozanskii LLAP-1 TaxID=1212489 RepID=A0A0W0SWD6_9GAMM|nr:Ammonium Transporter Family protein [Legionella drozanskii LLAP-1]